MEAYLPLLLVALIGGTTAGCAAVVLRVPVKILTQGTRISALERELAEIDAKLKKALRRIGIEERKAREKSPSTPTTPDVSLLPFPPDQENGEDLDPIEVAARLARVNALRRRRG